MTRPRLGIGSELLPVCLILATLAGSTVLVVSMHRRVAIAKKRAASPPVQPPKVATAPPVPSPVQLPPPPAPPPPEPTPAPPVEDPTHTALAHLGATEAEQLIEARAADRKAERLERATRAAQLDSQRWKRREQLVRSQIDSLSDRTRALEQEADALAMERDVLAHELDSAKAALARAQTRSSYAILPNRAPNGTWRRPIVIECHNGTATIQPGGPTFNMLDLSVLSGARSSPILLAVVRELSRIQGTTGPDGAPTVPYIFFIVRPDGIRPYYDARARLESLGIAFGYELVDQDMEIDFPDLDHPDEWDGSPPLSRFPSLATAGTSGSDADSSPASRAGAKPGAQPSIDDFRWPTGTHGSNEELDPLMGQERRLALGGPERGGTGSGGRSFDRQGIPAARGNGGFSNRGAGLPFEEDADRAGVGRGGSSELADSPGMLPPRTGSLGQPNRLPSTGPVPYEPGRLPRSFASPGRAGARNDGPETGLPPGLSSLPPGRSGVTGSSDPATRPFSRPNNDSTPFDGLTLPGDRPAAQGRFGRRGLLPGEPGAPPEDSPGTESRSGTGNGSTWGGQAGSPHGGSPAGIPLSGSGPASGTPGADSTGAQGGGGSGAGGSSGPGNMGTPGSPSRGPLRIEVPMEIVVACRPDGVVIHPGGYSLSKKVLQGKDPVFVRSLKTIVRLRQQVDPMIRPLPSVKFLVESGGGETYREVRRQTVLSDLDWPTALQVADTQVLGFLPRERY